MRDIRTASSPETIQQIVKQTTAAGAKGQTEDAIAEARRRARDLKELIIKTADEVTHYADRIVTELNEVYVAKSDFGEYTQSVETTIEQTAQGVVDSYHYSELIEALSGEVGALDTYLTTINGQIRRGIVTDPGTQQQVLGITISENLQFTGTEYEEGGVTYYELTPGQTFGMYTSTGWQFWVNGVKIGWFDSSDSKLHVSGVVAEDNMQLGGDWLITHTGGFGIRYIGGN
ncbi:MAG: hypothetical protein IK149_01755 [Oscillospiraceae bacterium]|nr:hypothetical protein [Oscillospiraceae bacterium]